MFTFQAIVDSMAGKNGSVPQIPDIPSLPGREAITAAGERTLWVAFAILAASAVVFTISAMRQPQALRLFHYITIAIVGTASVAYFCMANHIGAAFIDVPGKHGSHAVREVFYARYIDWMITTPLLLLDLALLAGIPAVDIVLLIVADVAMIGTGLLAALNTAPVPKWGLYILSNVFYLFVIYGLLVTGRKSSFLRSDAVGKTYVGLSVFTLVLWTAYPVVWALSEGKNYIHADTEVVVYAVLDVAAKAVFGLWLLGAHAAMGDTHVPFPASWVSSTEAGYGAVGSTARD